MPKVVFLEPAKELAAANHETQTLSRLADDDLDGCCRALGRGLDPRTFNGTIE